MNKVRDLYRNVINPWQTPSEIKAGERHLDRMFFKLGYSEELLTKILLLDRPDWDWSKPK